MYVLERILGRRQPMGAPAHRGTAVEAGIAAALMENAENATEIAVQKYNSLMALSTDKRREDYGATIPAMVEQGIAELKDYGVPSHTQGFVEWRPEGLAAPIVGYFDFHWEDHNITTDLKTTEKLPSAVKVAHARQVALYVTSNNADARVTYVTPKKRVTYQIDHINEHRNALHRIALNCEKWLAQSDDPEFFIKTTAPDYESFYWSGPARQIGYEIWGF